MAKPIMAAGRILMSDKVYVQLVCTNLQEVIRYQEALIKGETE